MARCTPIVLHWFTLFLEMKCAPLSEWKMIPTVFCARVVGSKQFEPGFWQDPSAFDGNCWSIGYPTFLADIKSIFGIGTASLQLVYITQDLILILFPWLTSIKPGALPPDLNFLSVPLSRQHSILLFSQSRMRGRLPKLKLANIYIRRPTKK